MFCSVANISSDKDDEQLLGRVLRMPYAKRRFVEQLNCAYAHVSSPSFSMAARQLRDKLVDMGFEELEVATYLQPYQTDMFPEGVQPTAKKETPLVIDLETAVAQRDLPPAIADRTSVSVEAGKTRLIVRGDITESDGNDLIKLCKDTQDKKAAAYVADLIRFHRLRQEAAKSPA